MTGESAACATLASATTFNRMQSMEQALGASTWLDATTYDWCRSFMAAATRWKSWVTGVANMCCGTRMSEVKADVHTCERRATNMRDDLDYSRSFPTEHCVD